MKKTLKLKEIVVLAMISVVIGVVFLGIDAIYRPLQAIAGPIGGDIIYGLYLISALLSTYIVRKPGAALAGSLFTGIVNLLLGSPYGINIIVASTLQGLGVELGIALGGYKRYNLFQMSLASIFAMTVVSIRDYFVFGFALYEGLIPIMLVVRVLSSIVTGAGVSMLLGNALAKTGALSGFEITK
ncbi:MAG: ECF transporter S component [Tissierellia bacterium]|nr:ECF transporter S component [Tissierellia bacterium]